MKNAHLRRFPSSSGNDAPCGMPQEAGFWAPCIWAFSISPAPTHGQASKPEFANEESHYASYNH
jgi:hypothetical protein